MKNAKPAPDFYQRDNEIKSIKEGGNIIAPSISAWKDFAWTKDYFEKKPKGGFFIWVKEGGSFPMSTLIEIASFNISQKLDNLIVVEKDAELSSFCHSLKSSLKGVHSASTKIIIKEGVALNYSQRNVWKQGDEFSAHYQFLIEKGGRLKSSTVNYGTGSRIKTREDIFLLEKGASADFRIKMIADKKTEIESESYMYGEDETRGHLECTGVIIDKDSKIASVPGIICDSNKAMLTHEATIGRIAEEELTYLRMRGLSEKKATELIISSFLNS